MLMNQRECVRAKHTQRHAKRREERDLTSKEDECTLQLLQLPLCPRDLHSHSIALEERFSWYVCVSACECV